MEPARGLEARQVAHEQSQIQITDICEARVGQPHNGAMHPMKPLKYIPKVSDDQIDFGAKLGLDLRGCTLSVAAARIEDAVDVGFRGASHLRHATPKQVALAAKFGYKIACLSRREGDAVIDDLMTELNHDAIAAEELAPGVAVVNIHDTIGRTFVISSIHPDGTVYFRGGGGQRAWARSLRRAATMSDSRNRDPAMHG